MRLEVRLPAIVPLLRAARVLRVLVREGQIVAVGAPLFEVEVDLSDSVAHDCPPQTYYRLFSREAGVIRSLSVAAGDAPEVGGVMAVVTRGPEDPVDLDARPLRVSTAAVLPRWDEIV